MDDAKPGRYVKVVAALVCLTLLTAAVQAEEITPKDIQVIGRTLGFMEDATAGTLELGIVYLRGEPESLRQAMAMQRLVGAGPGAGRFTFLSRLVAADELPALDHAGALFIVPEAGQAAPAAAATAHRLHVPVLSTDATCVQAGYCVLSFRSAPTVEIIFNRGAAEEAGVRFTAAFRMLVKKI